MPETPYNRYEYAEEGDPNWNRDPGPENIWAKQELEIQGSVATFGDLPDADADAETENGQRRRYYVREDEIVVRDTGTGWEIVGGLGSEDRPLPASHFEAVDTEDLDSITPLVEESPRGFGNLTFDNRNQFRFDHPSAEQKPMILWEFDDGHESIWTHRDVFDTAGIDPHLAIVPNWIDTRNDRATWDQLRQKQAGGWRYSNHGFDHNSFRDDLSTADAIESEIVDAIQKLNEEGIKHQHYTYSYGHHGGMSGQNLVSQIYPAGWSYNLDNYPDHLSKYTAYKVPRYSADNVSLSTLEGVIDEAVSQNTGLVLTGHKITSDTVSGSATGETSRDKITHIADYARDQGMEWTNNKNELLRYSEQPGFNISSDLTQPTVETSKSRFTATVSYTTTITADGTAQTLYDEDWPGDVFPWNQGKMTVMAAEGDSFTGFIDEGIFRSGDFQVRELSSAPSRTYNRDGGNNEVTVTISDNGIEYAVYVKIQAFNATALRNVVGI